MCAPSYLPIIVIQLPVCVARCTSNYMQCSASVVSTLAVNAWHLLFRSLGGLMVDNPQEHASLPRD